MTERAEPNRTPAVVGAEAATTQASAMDVFEKNARSFWLASLFLPKAVAKNAAAVYLFCRHVDDVADDAVCRATARSELHKLEIAVRTGARSTPAVRTFLDTSERCDFAAATGLALIEGVTTDLGTVRIKDHDELHHYAYCVAGVVGEMMMGVLKVEDKLAKPHAIALGLAMQLTNICRDVREDALLDRVYLPETLLQKYGVATDKVLTLSATGESIRPVIDELLAMADALYDRALQGMAFIPFRSRVGILIARRVYRAIGHKLQRKHGSNPFHGRTVVSAWGKTIQVLLALLDTCRPVTWRWFGLARAQRGAPTTQTTGWRVPDIDGYGCTHQTSVKVEI